MKVLTVNCGSSSIKFELFDMHECTTLADGLLEKVGEPTGRQRYRLHHSNGPIDELSEELPLASHQAGLQRVASWLSTSGAIGDTSELVGIGHRVAHGGAELTQPTIINSEVMATIQRLVPLAPLHNQASLCGIEVAIATWPDIPQVAVFDTAFHHTMPAHARHYALPIDLAQTHNIRRYGFHGTSHQFVSAEAAQLLARPLNEVNLIVLHLGNGASATAIRGGQSIDTSMGMTPLEGLMMGTRCGDLDPGIPLHLTQVAGMPSAEVEAVLNRDSGLKGICGFNDMREILRLADEGEPQSTLAVEMYTYRIKKYIGAYTAVLPGVDAIVFTAGIGENSPDIRARACSGLENLGIEIDADKNSAQQSGSREINSAQSQVKVLVIPTNEELEMAKQTLRCVSS